MDKVQIEIQDSDNSILGVLDVGDVKNFPLALTSSIADLRDITVRSGSYSTPFKVPSTKNNDDLLEHIYLSEQKNYKDFDAEKECIIRVNGIDVQGGKLQITKINSLGREGAVTYSFKFFGNNMDWVLDMKGYKTKDLPYLNKTLTYDDTSVQASWSNVGGTEDELYCYINRGSRISPNTVNVGDLRPDYFLLDYLESAFDLIGYNFESTFFNTTESKQLIIPFFGKNFKILQSEIDDNFVDVSLAALHTNIDTTVPNVANGWVYRIAIPLVNVCNSTSNSNQTWSVCSSSSTTGSYTENQDDNNNFASGIFTAPITGYYRVDGFFETLQYFNTTTEQTAGQLTRNMQYTTAVNGGSASLMNPVSSGLVVQANPNLLRETWVTQSNGIYMDAGDTLQVSMLATLWNSGGVTTSTLKADIDHAATSSYTITLLPDMQEGDTYNWGDKSDDVVDVFDIIMDVFRIFNCYIRTNEAIRTVYVEPRDDFYNALSTATNKTDDIDDNIQVQLEYNSKTYTENHNFDYAKDDRDAYVNKLNKDLDSNLYSYEHSFPAKFKDGVTNYKTKVIAATHIIEDFYMLNGGQGGGNVNGAFTARLWDDADNLPVHSDDFAPRLLYFNYSEQRNDSGSRSHWLSYRSTYINTFPYALPYSLINVNYQTIGYGAVAGCLSWVDTFAGGAAITTGLWSTYFSKTSQEIEDGKRVKLNMRFDLVDWVNFDFRDIVYFDNRYPELEGYWRYEKINNFTPTGTAISTSFDLVQARTFPTAASEDIVSPPPSEFRVQLPNGGGNRSGTTETGKRTINQGYDNFYRDGSNHLVGHNLRANGDNQLIMGMYNQDSSTDVSTDLLQFGVGTESAARSLIRVDENGTVYFNETPLPPPEGLVIDISTDTTADIGVDTYLVDTSAGDVTVTLPTPITPVGKKWNIKKLDGANTMTIDCADLGADPVTIEGDFSVTATIIYTSLTPQFDGLEFYII